MQFAKEVWPFVVPVAGLATLLAGFGDPKWAAAAGLVAVGLLLFFRIPIRHVQPVDDLALSPANGKVLKIDRCEDPNMGPDEYHRVVIFLSVFNVHVQRSPVGGQVAVSRYLPGRKLAAFNPQAGEVNEQQLTVLRRPNGELVGVKQIAGLLARRVVTYLEPGQEVTQGALMGIIKFGSRVDLLLPLSYHLQVEVGQKLHEGSSIVARLREELP